MTIDYRAVVDALRERRAMLAEELDGIDAAVDAISRLILRRTIEKAGSNDPTPSRVDSPVSSDSNCHTAGPGVRGVVAPPNGGGDTAGVAASEAAPSVASAAQLSPIDRHDLGIMVAEKRHARGLSQREVGAEIGCSGVTLGYVEAGSAKASVDVVARAEAWAVKSHPCDVEPHVRTRTLPTASRAGSVDLASPEGSRRNAASRVREARLARGLSWTDLADVLQCGVSQLVSIESAKYVDADLIRRAVAWAQGTQP